MNVVFFGTPKEVVPVLENLAKQFDVVAVVTTPDKKSGRKQQLTPTPIKEFALKHKFPVLQPENNNTLKSLIFNLKSDLFVVAAYGKLIPNEILTIPKHGAINIHPSLLPKYRGPTPIQTALLNGDPTSGLTFIKMDEEMDHGPILHQIPFTLENTDTFGWLMKSKFAQAAVILPQVITDYISGKLEPLAQDESKVSYTKMITKQDGFIDLHNPPRPEKLDQMIRAFYPWPSVWTEWKMENGKSKIIKFLPDKKLQVEGKKPMDLKDFLNGYPNLVPLIAKLYK